MSYKSKNNPYTCSTLQGHRFVNLAYIHVVDSTTKSPDLHAKKANVGQPLSTRYAALALPNPATCTASIRHQSALSETVERYFFGGRGKARTPRHGGSASRIRACQRLKKGKNYCSYGNADVVETGGIQKCHESLNSLLTINWMVPSYGWLDNPCPRMSATGLYGRPWI